MDNYLITVVFLSFFTKTVLTEADLQQQNADQDQLNPLNDYEDADNSPKAQDKRTIFSSTASNYGWAKHVGYHPSGFKYVLGYTPVNLKYTPAIRPLPSIKHQGYYYSKPKVHLHLKRPVVQIKPPKHVYGVPWKPATTFVKPVLSVNVPPSHHHLGPAVAVAKPVHVDHVHTHVDHIHSVPHVDHVHKVPVHLDHVHTVGQPVHVHPVPLQPVPQPLVPALAPPQFIPSPLFEVTKPNLGVLPLGAVFPSPILRNIPSPVAVQLPLKPALVPQPVAPHPIPLPPHQHGIIPLPPPTHFAPQPALPVAPPAVIPQPIAPQPVYPPGTVVEYHGSTNFINLAKGHIPILPQTPVNAVQPHHYYFQYPPVPQNIPVRPHEHHDVQTPLVPASHPHFFQQPVGQPQFQQQLPQDSPSHFQPADQGNPHDIFQQQLPINQQSQFQPIDQGNPHDIFQQQLPVNEQSQFHPDHNNQNLFQHQLPQDSQAQFQPADQVSSQHFFQHPVQGQRGQFQEIDQSDGGYIYQQPDASSAQQGIHPGQTDLQLPLHLPHHPSFVQNSRQFQSGNIHDPSQFSESVFRPSIQLEPPYKK